MLSQVNVNYQIARWGSTTSVMDDQAVEDDGYADDDLDALPVHAFHELQQSASRSTQQPHVQFPLANGNQHSTPQLALLAGGFGESTVGGYSAYASASNTFQQPSSDYGDFDDEMLDGEIYDATEEPALVAKLESHGVEKRVGQSTQREQWRRLRYGGPPANKWTSEQRSEQKPATIVPLKTTDVPRVSNQATQRTALHSVKNHAPMASSLQANIDVDILQAQVQEVCLP